ncbi:hypothetical protein EV182_000141 [Spiromyces aspiralis]|uniref:Uncharacterized protein n=1 Tax=Spiromyces aspiralis TaxID=68401 RepID=A0ACC1I0V7_9FUNG|nr:hypothetical protein EV182_000141 [Spiromyces aspiralis]
MLISKQNRKLIYEALFKDGVLVAKKDFNIKHKEIRVPNLEVIMAMKSLNSRGYITTIFSWQYFYYTLTEEGIEYLRQYLNLPAGIVPNSMKRVARPAAPRFSARPEREGAGFGQGRDEYRRRSAAPKEGADGSFRPQFRGGF